MRVLHTPPPFLGSQALAILGMVFLPRTFHIWLKFLLKWPKFLPRWPRIEGQASVLA